MANKDPTWKGIVPHDLARGNGDERTVGGPKVESSREPFIAPSGLGQGKNIGSTSVTGMNILFVVLWQVWSKSWVVHWSWELVAKPRMMESMSRSVGAGKQFPGSYAVRGQLLGSSARLWSQQDVAQLPQRKDRRQKGVFPHFVRVWESIVMGFGDVDL